MIQQKGFTAFLIVIAAAVCFLASLTAAGQHSGAGDPQYQRGQIPSVLEPGGYQIGQDIGNGPHFCPPDSNGIWGHPWVEDPPQYRYTGTDAAPPYGPSVVGACVIDGYLIDLSLMVADMIDD